MITESDTNLIIGVYYNLWKLLSSEPWLHSQVDCFRNENYDYLKSEACPLSAETKQQFFLFLENLNTYFKENSFSVDESFVYLDKNWHVLLIEYLVPLLELLRNDFEPWNIEVPVKPEKIYHPTDEEIVERARYWFDLMKKHKILRDY